MSTFNTGAYPPGCTQQDVDEAQPGYSDDFDLPAPCPECGGDGGFEEAGSGKWSACTFCDGAGDVESEVAVGLRDLEERSPPWRRFTAEEDAAWEAIFAGIPENGCRNG